MFDAGITYTMFRTKRYNAKLALRSTQSILLRQMSEAGILSKVEQPALEVEPQAEDGAHGAARAKAKAKARPNHRPPNQYYRKRPFAELTQDENAVTELKRLRIHGDVFR